MKNAIRRQPDGKALSSDVLTKLFINSIALWVEEIKENQGLTALFTT